MQTLKNIDRKIRYYVKKWCNFPKDVPNSLFYTNINDGGLGLVCLQIHVLILKLKRFNKLRNCSDPFVRSILDQPKWVKTFKRWCNFLPDSFRSNIDFDFKEDLEVPDTYCEEDLLRENVDQTHIPGAQDVKRYFKNCFYKSHDGRDSASHVSSSKTHAWLHNIGNTRFRTNLWREMLHIRCGCVRTKVRNTRGRPQTGDAKCRFGCMRPESQTHILQACSATFRFRMDRHDRITTMIKKILSSKGYTVHWEHVLKFNNDTFKPDLIAIKDSAAIVLMVISITTGRIKSTNTRHQGSQPA